MAASARKVSIRSTTTSPLVGCFSSSTSAASSTSTRPEPRRARTVSRTRKPESVRAAGTFSRSCLKEELRLDPRVERYSSRLRARACRKTTRFSACSGSCSTARPQSAGFTRSGSRRRENGEGGRGRRGRRNGDSRFASSTCSNGGAVHSTIRASAGSTLRHRPATSARSIVALYECWEQGYLPPERIERLLETLYGSYVRTERGPGYLLTVEEDERAGALGGLPAEARTSAGHSPTPYSRLRRSGDARSSSGSRSSYRRWNSE